MTKLNRRHLLAATATLAVAHAPAGQSAALSVQPSVPAPSPRQRLNFDRDWRFAFGHAADPAKDFGFGLYQNTFAKQGTKIPAAQADFDDKAWRLLNLPHDWAVELPFVENTAYKPTGKPDEWDTESDHGYKPVGRKFPETSVGWYRKAFTLDAADAGKRISLEFDGIFRNATIMVNGYVLAQHESGYTPVSVDVTDFLNTDDKPNIVTVRVDASLGEGWFYEGAGIYRHVWLVKANPVHIPQYGVCVRAKTDGTVEVTTTVRNDSDELCSVGVSSLIFKERKGLPLTQDLMAIEIPAHEERSVTQRLSVPLPELWSLEQPTMHEIVSALIVEQKLVDPVTTPFGFRDVKFDPDTGFFLNGKSVKLKGTCNHQDHAGVGSAIPDALQVWRLEQLKSMGCNAYRAAHNPPTPELLDACDRMGILVIDETRLMTSSPEGLAQLETMVVRDRNHPSIILWSIGNEEPQQGTKRGAKVARTMKRLINQLDPTRLITAAMDSGFGEGITEVLDVIGFNYRDGKIDDFHKKWPKLPIIGTETASTVSTRGEYARDNSRQVVPAYDIEAPWWASTAENWWPHFNARPFIGGGFIWTGFDYRGEPTPFNNWPSVASQFGALDSCGFPKDAYYYYRAWWRPEPLLHLFPHWNWPENDKAGKTVAVWAYSNCDEVELFVNGKSAGKKAMPKDRHVEWQVAYQPGKIEAFGYKGGKVVLKDARTTAGKPARIALTSDRTKLKADGVDVAVIKAEIQDANGVAVPDANNLIRFSLDGPAAIIGVGNGNPNSHEPDKASQRMAFNGLCMAILQTGDKASAIRLVASGEGLRDARLNLMAT
jgi:beta-galactosidase